MQSLTWFLTNFLLILLLFARPVNALDAGNAMCPPHYYIYIMSNIIILSNKIIILLLSVRVLGSAILSNPLRVASQWRSWRWPWLAFALLSATSRVAGAIPRSSTPNAYFSSHFWLVFRFEFIVHCSLSFFPELSLPHTCFSSKLYGFHSLQTFKLEIYLTRIMLSYYLLLVIHSFF